MTSKVIILHGPSSSGKSTIGKRLQQEIELPFWRLLIDVLRDGGVLPTERLAQRNFHWSDLKAPFFDGFHRSLSAYASAGNHLIVEHIFDNAQWVSDLKTLLGPYDVFFVGLHCGINELRRRETLRADRPIGSAEEDYHSVHKGRTYDVEVNSEKSCEENTAVILQAWRSGLRRSEFARL